MLGSGKRLAIISGQICREGDHVSIIDKRDKTITYEFLVEKINRQSVQLEVSGRIFTLELSQPRLAHGDDLEHGKPQKRN